MFTTRRPKTSAPPWKWNPTTPAPGQPGAFARIECGQFQDAVWDFDELIKLAPDNSHAYHGRACAYAGLDQPGLAIEDFDRAIALDPGDAESHYQRGMVRMELGQYAEAVEDLDQAARLDPQHPYAESDREAAAELAGGDVPE